MFLILPLAVGEKRARLPELDLQVSTMFDPDCLQASNCITGKRVRQVRTMMKSNKHQNVVGSLNENRASAAASIAGHALQYEHIGQHWTICTRSNKRQIRLFADFRRMNCAIIPELLVDQSTIMHFMCRVNAHKYIANRSFGNYVSYILDFC